MAKHSVTNNSDGPRVLNSTPPIVLQAGESTDGPVEISDAELASAKAAGYFDLDGSAGDGGPASLAGKTKAQLLEVAAAEGVVVAEDATNAQITEAIEAKRAA